MQETIFGVPPEHPEPKRKVNLPPKWKRAYPAQPGTGPPGQTCKTCKHYFRNDYHAKVYLKCGLMQNAWTHGAASDIKASSPACSNWWIKLKGGEK